MRRSDIDKMDAGEKMDKLISLRIVSKQLPASTWRNGRTVFMEMVNDELRDIPSYSTDIKAAWEVMEALPSPAVWKTYDKWECLLDAHYGCAIEDTAPLAICRAALLSLCEEE